MRGFASCAGDDDLVVCSNTADADARGAVGRRCGVFPHDSGIRRALKVAKVVRGGGEIRTHALQCVDVHAAASHIYGTVLLRDNVTGDVAAWPVGVEHTSPWFLGVGAVSGRAVGAGHDARSEAGEGQVDNGGFGG